MSTNRGAASDGTVQEQLGRFSTSAVSDALDRSGIAGQVLGIRPLGAGFRLCGPAWTVQYAPSNGRDGGTVGDFLDDVPPGSVIVIDNGGRLDATVWGDLMTTVANRNRVAGTVIDGVSRDSVRALELGYPIFARSSFMRTGKDRVAWLGCGVAVTIGGQPVRPDDVVIGDADGVVVVPQDAMEEVLSVVMEIESAEELIRAEIAKGSSLREARARVGYHKLQSRR